MLENISKLNIVRIGSYITHSSLKEIGNKLLESFQGKIKEFKVSHYDSLVIDNINAYLLTMILDEKYGGHTSRSPLSYSALKKNGIEMGEFLT